MGDTDEIEKLLGKLVITEDVRGTPKKRTLEEYRRSWEARTAALQRLVEQKKAISEGYLPSDEVDAKNDVAFGVTKKDRRYLDATMVDDEEGNPPRNRGTISHIGLLAAAGYAKSETDPNPTDDYAVRGIVKDKLGGRVIFWEDTPTLTSARHASFVKQAIENLLDRGIIKPEAEVFGAGEDVAVGTAEDIRRDW